MKIERGSYKEEKEATEVKGKDNIPCRVGALLDKSGFLQV